MLVLFTTTQKFFESWVAAVLNYTILLVLAVFVSLLIIALLNALVATLGTPSAMATIGGAFNICILLALGILILRQTPQLAANLGGGIAIQTAGAFSNFANQTKLGAQAGLSVGRGLNKAGSGIGRGISAARGRFGTGIGRA